MPHNLFAIFLLLARVHMYTWEHGLILIPWLWRCTRLWGKGKKVAKNPFNVLRVAALVQCAVFSRQLPPLLLSVKRVAHVSDHVNTNKHTHTHTRAHRLTCTHLRIKHSGTIITCQENRSSGQPKVDAWFLLLLMLKKSIKTFAVTVDMHV